jgi:hypothetical protein
MADEKPDKETEITPKGAVEVNEEDLDQASGAGEYMKISLYELRLDSSKPDYDLAGQKAVPQDASIGLLKEAEKNI